MNGAMNLDSGRPHRGEPDPAAPASGGPGPVGGTGSASPPAENRPAAGEAAPAAGGEEPAVAAEPQPVDVLVIGAHPDDAEIGMGGTLVKLHRLGYRIGVIDLTRGELGSKGTPERRAQEAAAAARVYGARFRLNLNLGDNRVEDSPALGRKVAALIRRCRPRLVFTHHGDDRHPDHRGASSLVRRAVFQAALRNLDLGEPYHLVDALLFFPVNEWVEPRFVVDVTETFAGKLEAMRAFASQFVEPTAPIDHKYFGVEDYLEAAVVRARHYGLRIGVRYGEAFVADAVPVADPVAAFRR
ncbi:LmbE family protein [Thermaerobacter marianensis DSM 12885]|uniref:LmbE family protein n=1 Tax=Thermaerobacter marianensis (strain ATCC 700841 / DSM 12885 / JCM 10246 / 7p75a) TaxID=644966 RepID=E6SK78_THEM7|nr:bacillithiol biosynthesis deacetylase BshB1 [Thermaerobacter marianensis]ADU52236.1 LmbE family protein [Thermaerobacter marianensis DSM 12885]